MYNGNLKDKIFEGRWKVTDYDSKSCMYELENIYNGRKLYLYKNTLVNVVKKKISISYIISKQAKEQPLANLTKFKYKLVMSTIN